MLNSIRTKNVNCEQEAKFIQERIALVEKYAAELCHAFGAFSRKAARIRDKGDELAKVSLCYAEAEEINGSLSEALANFASSMSILSDYGDLRVQNIDNKVVNELTQYENICKHSKNEVRQIFAARDKELTKRRQLDRIRDRNPRNRQQILQAETELVKATTEVTKTIHNLEEQITTFERNKLHDLKEILLDFISGEMGYHARALELLTRAYQDVDAIDEESDLQDFKKSLRIQDSTAIQKRTMFRASHSLGSISNLFATPKKHHPGIPRTMQKSTKKISKSEEILDSPKLRDETENSVSDTENGDASDESKRDDKISPFIARRYLK